MRRDRIDAAALVDMVNAARGILLKMEGVSLEDFISNEDLRFGIERRFEILGEAARRISDDFKANHPDIPWREVVRQRNFISHEYDDIDPVRIRQVSLSEIPDILKQLEEIVAELRESGVISKEE